MNEFLQRDREPNNNLGYYKHPGKPKPDQVPVALTQEGQPVFDREFGLRTNPDTFQKFKWTAYDDGAERQRRLLADTALAYLALQNTEWVQNAVDLVGKGLRTYWLGLKTNSNDETINKIATNDSVGRRIYGKTSFGRRDEKDDKASAEKSKDSGETAVNKAKIDCWFSPLDKTPRDVPKLMSLYDYFYCKVLGGTATIKDPPLVANAQQSTEYLRADAKKATWRPSWYEQEGPRGRANVTTNTDTTSYPGLITKYFTIPYGLALMRCGLDLGDMVTEERKRGWDIFAPVTANMNPQFKQSLIKHNMHFSASASGTTSTLFLAAEAFAAISSSPLERQKEYLLACVIYLVAGGMHTCHEIFWAGKQVGIDIPDGKYIPALPASFTGTEEYKKWSTEFWEIVRDDRPTVR